MEPNLIEIVAAGLLVAAVFGLFKASGRWPEARRLNALLVVGIGGWYLWWRATETLVFDSRLGTVLGSVLFAAECYGFLSIVFFYLQTWSPLKRPPLPPLPDGELPTVDIFVTIYDEPPEVLFRTLVGCQAIRYPQ